MSGKKTLVWAVVCAALAAFYYFYEIKGGAERQEAKLQQELLLQFRPEQATALTITRPAGTITVVKHHEHWQLREPLQAPVDEQKLHELLHHLAELRFVRRLDDRPDNLEPFGLHQPILELQVQRHGHEQPLRLRLGAKNPTGSGHFTQVDGQQTLYVVSVADKEALDVSLYDLRDKTILAFTPAEVQEVRLEALAATTIVLQRQEAEGWQMTAPLRVPGDAQQVEMLLRRLQETRVRTFVAETPEDLAPYGLHTPALRLTLLVGPERTVHTLLFGAVNTEQQGVYATRSDTSHVVLLPQQLWEELPTTVTALRDKTLLRYDRERIVQLDMQWPEAQLRIVRTGPRQYALQHPQEAPGDTEAISSLLWDVQELKATDFLSEAPVELAAYGLDTPRLRVTLTEEATDEGQPPARHTLMFGNDAPKQQGTYVQIDAQPALYLVEHAAAQRILSTTAFALRDKRIMAFDPGTVHRLQLRYPDVTFTAERRSDTWHLTEPARQQLPQRLTMANLLHELSTLEYVRLTADADDTARYGLETPQVRITVWQTDGSAIGPLVVGTAPGAADATQQVYVRLEPAATVYAVKADFLSKLPKTQAEFVAEN